VLEVELVEILYMHLKHAEECLLLCFNIQDSDVRPCLTKYALSIPGLVLCPDSLSAEDRKILLEFARDLPHGKWGDGETDDMPTTASRTAYVFKTQEMAGCCELPYRSGAC
jgi:hypothetical protein